VTPLHGDVEGVSAYATLADRADGVGKILLDTAY
jgi:hypothetical protein